MVSENDKIYDPAAETMSRDELSALQSARLRDTVHRVYDNVRPYRAKMEAIGLLPGDIRGIEDIEKLPFTTKQDLRDSYPFGMFACPMEQVTRIHASSGTTGKQTVVGYTAGDIDMWAGLIARALAAAGATKSDIVHVSYGYGLFTGGLGAHYGVEKLGATVIPVSSGNTKRQIQIMRDFGSTVLMCTPSYALYLAETMEEMGVDARTLPLKAGIFGAEPWTEAMREEIDRRLDIKAYDIYGLSEIMGPGVSYECSCRNGMHVNEDNFIPEVIDPDTGEAIGEGYGELVFTCITKQALPLIRYRTRDISRLESAPCECGRVFRRMGKPRGRSDDMLIIRGVNVFPSQIESVLLELGLASPNYMLVVDRVGVLDTLEVKLEVAEEAFSDEVRQVESYQKRIAAALQSTLGIAAKVTLVAPKTIARSEGKAKRVEDRRKLVD